MAEVCQTSATAVELAPSTQAVLDYIERHSVVTFEAIQKKIKLKARQIYKLLARLREHKLIHRIWRSRGRHGAVCRWAIGPEPGSDLQNFPSRSMLHSTPVQAPAEVVAEPVSILHESTPECMMENDLEPVAAPPVTRRDGGVMARIKAQMARLSSTSTAVVGRTTAGCGEKKTLSRFLPTTPEVDYTSRAREDARRDPLGGWTASDARLRTVDYGVTLAEVEKHEGSGNRLDVAPMVAAYLAELARVDPSWYLGGEHLDRFRKLVRTWLVDYDPMEIANALQSVVDNHVNGEPKAGAPYHLATIETVGWNLLMNPSCRTRNAKLGRTW